MRGISVVMSVNMITLLTLTSVAEAASKKAMNRSELTPEQREELMREARTICKKKYGAEATVYKVNYRYRRVTCTNGTR